MASMDADKTPSPLAFPIGSNQPKDGLPEPRGLVDEVLTELTKAVERNKRLLALATIVIAAAVGAGTTLRYYEPKEVTTAKGQFMLAKYGDIQNGMTLAEVESVMGWPFDGHC